jgi:ribose 5-phosphate isomerase A
MNQDQKKQRAAEAALEFLRDGTVIGVGTGSTVNFFIDGLAALRGRIAGAVSSSIASTRRLEAHGIRCWTSTTPVSSELYVDGADEATRGLHAIKGGGGALTGRRSSPRPRAACLHRRRAGWSNGSAASPPVEVIPMARRHVASQLPVWRRACVAQASSPTSNSQPRRPQPVDPTRSRSRARSTRSPASSRSGLRPPGRCATGRHGRRCRNVGA